jgi:hypothetical protein
MANRPSTWRPSTGTIEDDDRGAGTGQPGAHARQPPAPSKLVLRAAPCLKPASQAIDDGLIHELAAPHAARLAALAYGTIREAPRDRIGYVTDSFPLYESKGGRTA